MIRPLILDSVEDEIRRLKFGLQWAFIQDTPAARSEAAQRLLHNLQSCAVIRFISFGQAVLIYRHHRSEIKALSVKERSTFESAPVWIRKAWERHRMISVKAALANSPTWW